MTGYQRNGNYMCIVNKYRNNYERSVPEPKADLKIMSVYYQLTKSKMTMAGSIGHVSDLPISCLYAVKKESSLKKEQRPVMMSFF